MSETEDIAAKLFELAKEAASLSFYQDYSEAEDPPWDKTSRVHDWKRHVPRELVRLWGDLPTEAKIVCYILCKNVAMSENWD